MMYLGYLPCFLAVLWPHVLYAHPELKRAPRISNDQFLTQHEIQRSIENLEKGDKNEVGEIVMTEEKSLDGKIMLTLSSENRNIEMRLNPSDKLIRPNARLRIIDGENNHEKLLHQSLRSAFYHGTIAGNSNGLVSLMKNNDGWNGLIMTGGQRYALHAEKGSSRGLLIPMESEDVEMLKEEDMNEYLEREQVFNMTGDESYTRSGESELELEIGVYTDEVLYTLVHEKYPNDDIEYKVSEVALITLNAVNMFYQSPSIGHQVAIVVASMNIMTKNPAEVPLTESMVTYLNTFCAWDTDNNNYNGVNYDLGLIFTGKDMYGTSGKYSVKGVAPMSHTCQFYTKQSCAVGEARGYGSSIVMAHEMGHNLGMPHDGSGNSCSKKGYIMGSMISPGASTFSTCSRDAFAKYLQLLDDFGMNCMRDKGQHAYEHTIEGKLPGERLPKGEQCRYSLGDEWKDVTKESMDRFGLKFCQSTWCEIPGQWPPKVKTATQAPPLPGTPCNDDGSKVCYLGDCTDRTKVISEIAAFTPSKGCASSHALSVDALCQKYEPSKPTGITYAVAKKIGANYGDMSNMCEGGLICQGSGGTRDARRLRYPPPPGVSCAEGKICKDLACVPGTPAPPTATSSGCGTTSAPTTGTKPTTGTNSSPKTQTKPTTGTNNAPKTPTTQPKAPTPKIGARLTYDEYCKSLLGPYATESAEYNAKDGKCTSAVCSLNGRLMGFSVSSVNLCAAGQVCKAGECTADNGETVEGALTGAPLNDAIRNCRNGLGDYNPLCTKVNLLMYPDKAKYCTNVCQYTACVKTTMGGGRSIKSTASPTGTSCGDGKTCKWYQCQ